MEGETAHPYGRVQSADRLSAANELITQPRAQKGKMLRAWPGLGEKAVDHICV